MNFLCNMKRLKDIKTDYAFLKGIKETQPELLVLVDTGEFIIDLDNHYDTFIHRDFRIREVALMKGFSGDYTEQEEKLNNKKPHESEFWVYLTETIKYRKEQMIKIDKAIIF
jgi:hypothetical protein